MRVPIVELQDIIPEKILHEVSHVLKSGYWADGSHVKELEQQFAEYCGVKYCRAVNNGTGGLMAMMMALGIGPGDEVIIPSFSFIATANCIKFTGATPVFAEIDPVTFTLDPTKIKSLITEKTKAIMPVHLYGLCADMKHLGEICDRRGLALLEDAAQAHGASIGASKAGTFGKMAVFSLYPTKNMFAGGEGGLITTDDEAVFEKIKLLVNHGQSHKYLHTDLGFNFRMPEINAVVAKYSLSQLETWTRQRNGNAARLLEGLEGVGGITLPTTPPGYRHVYHQFTIKTEGRTDLIQKLQEGGIGYGIHYGLPIHLQPYYLNQHLHHVDLTLTEKIAKQVLSLPIHQRLTEEQIDFVIAALKT